MSNKAFTPGSVVADIGEKESPLLDNLMDRGRQVLKEGGIDMEKLSKKTSVDDRYWEELDAVFDSVRTKLCTTLLQVTQDYVHLTQLPLENVSELAVTVNAFKQEMETISIQLMAVNARHQGKTDVVSTEEYTLFMSIFNDYAALGENVALAVAPVVVELTDFTQQAIAIINKEQLANASLDKNVVSEVDFKEV